MNGSVSELADEHLPILRSSDPFILAKRQPSRHVWTLPVWQGFFWRASAQDWSGHVFGLLMRPDDRWPRWVKRIGLKAVRSALMRDDGPLEPSGPIGSRGIGLGGLDAKAALAWLAVGIPLAWDVWKTLDAARVIFQRNRRKTTTAPARLALSRLNSSKPPNLPIRS